MHGFRSMLTGDSGCALKPWMLVPYLNPSIPAKEEYNRRHCRTCSCLEWSNLVLDVLKKNRLHGYVLQWTTNKTESCCSVCMNANKVTPFAGCSMKGVLIKEMTACEIKK